MSEYLSTSARDLLRHTLATIAYRGKKILCDAPDDFSIFKSGETTRTPGQVVAHLGDLFDWAFSMASGKPAWHDSQPQAWPKDVDRFFAALKKFDDFLAGPEQLKASPEVLFQGPVSDALNHLGQLAMLRRMAGSPIKGENYCEAEVVAGRVGKEQAPPKREF
jgi:hypothetical protein